MFLSENVCHSAEFSFLKHFTVAFLLSQSHLSFNECPSNMRVFLCKKCYTGMVRVVVHSSLKRSGLCPMAGGLLLTNA